MSLQSKLNHSNIGLTPTMAEWLGKTRELDFSGRDFNRTGPRKAPTGELIQSAKLDFPRHPMFLMMEALSSSASHHRWSAVLNLMLMLDGGESSLNQLYNEFPIQQAWSDYVGKRCKWLLPDCAWAIIDWTFNRKSMEKDYTYEKALHLLDSLVKDPALYQHPASGPIVSIGIEGSPIRVEFAPR
jgi:hypothetical protein